MAAGDASLPAKRILQKFAAVHGLIDNQLLGDPSGQSGRATKFVLA
jgi:hypothetical protein